MPALAGVLKTTRISLSSDSRQGNGNSFDPGISANGRFVAFVSYANNLVSPHSTSYFAEVFLRDRRADKTRRVSPSSFRDSYDASVSADGGFVVFESDDAFIRDMETGTTKRISVGGMNSYEPVISADGRFVAFVSATRHPACHVQYADEVFVLDRKRHKKTCASVSSDGTPGQPGGGEPSISRNGRFVAFTSFAPNLVPNDTNGATDIFVRDRRTDTTRRVSLNSDGEQASNQLGSQYGDSDAPSISANGRFVAFESDADNLVPGDTNQQMDVFVHDRKTDKTTRVSLGPGAVQANHQSYFPSISGGGRYVGFESNADNLVPDDANGTPDAFVRDRKTHETSLVGVSSTGRQATLGSGPPAISADGNWVAFGSTSPLVPGDTRLCLDDYGRRRNCGDVFVRGPLP